MSGVLHYMGGLQNPKPTRLTSTNATAVYTAVDDSATVVAILFANETASPVKVDLEFNDGSTDFLVSVQSIPGDEAGIYENAPLKLRNGDSIKVTAATANAITVTPIIVLQSPSEAVSTKADNTGPWR